MLGAMLSTDVKSGQNVGESEQISASCSLLCCEGRFFGNPSWVCVKERFSRMFVMASEPGFIHISPASG